MGLPGMIGNLQAHVMEGAATHGSCWTHADEVNAALLRFMAWPAA